MQEQTDPFKSAASVAGRPACRTMEKAEDDPQKKQNQNKWILVLAS
jgi:hypothetical protein